MKNMIWRATFLMVMILTVLFSQAQDEKKLDVNIDINKDSGATWYMQPWVWVVGAAVFILLLVAILKSGSRKEA